LGRVNLVKKSLRKNNFFFPLYVRILKYLRGTPPPPLCMTLLYFTSLLLNTHCNSGHEFLFYMRFATLWFRCCIPFRVFLISQQMYTEISFSQIVYLMYLTIFRRVHKIAKATLSFVMSVLSPVHTEQLGCHWNDHEI